MKNKRRKIKMVLLCLSTLIVLISIYLLIDYKLFMDRKIVNNLNYVPKYTSIDLNGSPIQLIGLSDSVGVPYTNEKNRGFFELLESHYFENKVANQSLNLFNLYTNKTWHIQGMLQNDISINEYRLIQNYSIDFNKEKFPNDIKGDIYFDNVTDNQQTILSAISGYSHPVCIYSCGANDLFYYFNLNPASMNLSSVLTLLKGKKEAVKYMEENISKNIETLKEVNPNIDIVILGIYNPFSSYIPYKLTNPLIKDINSAYSGVAEKYENVTYCDTSFLSNYIALNDFHPSDLGQKKLAEKIDKEVIKFYGDNQVQTNLDNVKKVTFSSESSKDIPEIANELYSELKNIKDNESYVQISVFIEDYFLRKKLDLTYYELKKLKTEIDKINSISNETSKALDVLLVERKIEEGHTEMIHTYKNLLRVNDKLSLKLLIFQK